MVLVISTYVLIARKKLVVEEDKLIIEHKHEKEGSVPVNLLDFLEKRRASMERKFEFARDPASLLELPPIAMLLGKLARYDLQLEVTVLGCEYKAYKTWYFTPTKSQDETVLMIQAVIENIVHHKIRCSDVLIHMTTFVSSDMPFITCAMCPSDPSKTETKLTMMDKRKRKVPRSASSNTTKAQYAAISAAHFEKHNRELVPLPELMEFAGACEEWIEILRV